MAIFRRGRRHPQDPGMTPFRAGLMVLVILLVATYFGFTKANPFANPYELQATFDTANNLKPRSPVRTAGVEIGKVTKVEPVTAGDGLAKVTMELKKSALPIHKDAQLKIRQRIFLEGNFFVDLQPGSPSAPTLDTGSEIPRDQTAAPVQFGQVLTALQTDTREDLQTFLREYSKGLEGKGARGFNESIRYWEDAYKNSALANDATLGVEPTRDLQRVVKGQQKLAAALVTDEEALKGLVTNLNTTAGALAREDVALEASIPALRDTLRAAQPALFSLNAALPSLRAFAIDALPGVRSSNPTLRRALPFIRQARRLVSRRELRGTAAVLRRYIPALVRFNQRTIPLADEGRQLSACTNKVLVPLLKTPIPEPEMADAGNSNQLVRWQIQRSFPGLAGESRGFDGNNHAFRAMSVSPGERVIPAPPPDGGSQPPPHRPDVPCETQQVPNLGAPSADPDELTYTPTAGASYVNSGPRVSEEQFNAAIAKARKEWPKVAEAVERDQLKNLEYFKEKAREAGVEVPKLP